MNSAEILTIGSELLQGSTLNSNAQYLGKELTSLGFQVNRQTACVDSVEKIEDALGLALDRSDLVIATGGLGPTPDDVTREAVAAYFRTDLVFNPEQYRNIQNYFRRTKQKNIPITRREAYFPRIAHPILNRAGIALGFYVEDHGKILVVLPGVPREMIHMFEHEVRRMLLRKFKQALLRLPAFTVSLAGLGEPQVMQKLRKSFFGKRDFEFGIYPKLGWISIKVRSKSGQLIKTLRREMLSRLGKAIYTETEEPIESAVSKLLTKRRKTISVAESCTGGLLAKRLTDHPGASQYFRGGILAYADSVKRGVLNVPAQILKMHGAVSKQTAILMAKNVRALLKTDYSIAVTGIAGPSGGSKQKPVGTVWIAVASEKSILVKHFLIGGNRDRIRQVSAVRAFHMIYSVLR